MNNRRVWIALGAVLLANYFVLFAQNIVAFWQWRHCTPLAWFFPEVRYFLQGFILLLPLIPLVLLKFRHGKKVLVVLVVALVVHAVCFLVKAHVPGTRRQQYVSACNWAADAIRADYNGPRSDSEPFFSWLEYHPLNRPCIDAHVTRVSYLVGGRGASLTGCGLKDIPDYIVDEPHKINRDWWCVADYEKLAERRFGRREFIIYKRIK